MLYELRRYRIRTGRIDDWVRLMEERIIPFQVEQGMVIIGSFRGEEDPDLYVWIRRFVDEEEREALYQRVYQSRTWKEEISPVTGEMLIREEIQVTRLTPTPKSVLQ
jgi:hypothetical protein